MAKVTVISIFYNREESVERSVSSLLLQDYQDLKIILVDDGSSDGTLDALRSAADERCEVRTGANLGFTNQLCRTIATSSSEYVAIHGAGDVSKSMRITKQVDALDADGNLGMVGCYVRDWGPGEMGYVDLKSVVPANATQKLVDRNFFTHGEVMFRRSAYEEVGGYRPFFRFAQDRDLWCRLSRVSNLGNCKEVLYERFAQANSVSSSPRKSLGQWMFSDFAAYCHATCLSGFEDPLDRIGPAALLLRPPSAALIRRLSDRAAGLAKSGDRAGAEEYLRLLQGYAGRYSLTGMSTEFRVRFPVFGKLKSKLSRSGQQVAAGNC
ncbi:glycosyltransferase family 2 protein [Rhodopirellula sp. MGV]|uniref:glycosyltransferase family 2 protein n=1 Tax=Rhodopirellula sp. MGV TaxID=2023130 RepID=UPI000B95E03E|nr:glycosyltransferase [Rhodopirellula sp. MGV]OYP34107.1 hypothetical protein CGZ80_16410 [Rhodopirellula sp. MGV]PNY35620.1 family 2 glycosyl transferase [Rhodopirellula baltica]